MADLARQIPDVLRLEAGDPNFYISSHGIEAAARAGHDGFTKYAPSGGFSTLRQLVADKVRDLSARSSAGIRAPHGATRIVPGSAFGPGGEEMIRVSLSVAPAVLNEGSNASWK